MQELTALAVDSEAGRFSSSDRSVIAAQCLPLLATYFADAPTWALANQGQLAALDPETDDVANFVRMRVALASLARLEPILTSILIRPSFFYAAEVEESVGDVRGNLDMTRYVRTRLRPESPRRYPVRVINRQYTTPENTAAAYAALLMMRELSDAPLHVLPTGAPEYRQVLDGVGQIQHWLAQPALLQNRSAATRVRSLRDLPGLVGRARQRLDEGRVAAADRYDRLLDWLERVDKVSAGASAGDIEWSFYDERFDTKLFEIWSLSRLIESLESVLGVPTQAARSLLERGQSPMRSWNFGAVKIRLLFQPALSRLADGDATWRFTEPKEADLGGFPDLAVTIDPVSSDRFTILVDPKLRQRRSAPSDELYKVLGYFGNLPPQPVRGAILFYAPGDPRIYRLEADSPSEMLAIGIDPSDQSTTSSGFERLARLVQSAAGVGDEVVALLSASAGDSEAMQEASSAVRQQAAVDAMLGAAVALPVGSLAPTEKTTSANLARIWDRLGPEVQRMLVTAEFFGSTAPEEADHSGPLLGLAAACERLLVENVFGSLMKAQPDAFFEGATFGTMIHWLTDANRRRPRDDSGRHLADEFRRAGPVDGQLLGQMTGDLRRLNVTYRIPAAHRELVPQRLWAEGRSLIIDPTVGLLVRLVEATSRA